MLSLLSSSRIGSDEDCSDEEGDDSSSQSTDDADDTAVSRQAQHDQVSLPFPQSSAYNNALNYTAMYDKRPTGSMVLYQM